MKNIEKVECMGKTERQGKMYRIYLVEDDVIIARSIKKTFRKLGI